MTTSALSFSREQRHDYVRDNNAFFVEIMSTLRAIKGLLQGHVINVMTTSVTTMHFLLK